MGASTTNKTMFQFAPLDLTSVIRIEDYDMDLIKIVDAKTGEPMGTMNWFSVHATSMKSTSGLISGAKLN